MNLNISIREPQAEELRRQASVRQITPEEAAGLLLGDLLSQLADNKVWYATNQRRAELIKKSRISELTVEETKELDYLQSTVDERLAPMDRQLIAVADEFRRLAESMPDAASS